MHARNAVMIAVLVAACPAQPAPEGWLPTPDATPEWTRGGWIELELRTGDSSATAPLARGELLAVSADSGWVLTDSGIVAVAAAGVARATLVGWDPETGKLTTWALIGTLSTVANGYILVLTAPMWIIGGSLATASHSRRPVLDTEDDQWPELRLYARFPQGLPPGLDRATLGTLVR